MRNQDHCDISLSTRYPSPSIANDNDDDDDEDIFAAVPRGGLMTDLMLPILEESCIQQQIPRDNHTPRMLLPYVPRVSLAPYRTLTRRNSPGGHEDRKVMDPTSVVVMDFQKQYRRDHFHDTLDPVLPAPVGEPEDMARRRKPNQTLDTHVQAPQKRRRCPRR